MLITSPGIKVRLLRHISMFALERSVTLFLSLKNQEIIKWHFSIRLIRDYPKLLPGLQQRKMLGQSCLRCLRTETDDHKLLCFYLPISGLEL